MVNLILVARATSEDVEDNVIYHEFGWVSDVFILADLARRGAMKLERLPSDETSHATAAGEYGVPMVERAFGWEVLYARPDRPEPPRPWYAIP